MSKIFIINVISVVIRLIYSIRYKIQVVNDEVLKNGEIRKKPLLVLHNHPGFMDPVLLMTILLRNALYLRPVFSMDLIKKARINVVADLLRGAGVPNLDVDSTDRALSELKESYQVIIEGLKKGDKWLIAPAGGMKETSKEKIGGRSMVYQLLRDVEGVQVLLVRVTGCWGSSTSKAHPLPVYTPFAFRLWYGIKLILKNFLFLVPKRKIIIEFEKAPADFPFKGSKLELTRYLEHWFNQYPTEHGRVEEEPVQLVREFFLSKKKPKLLLGQKEKDPLANLEVPSKMREEILAKVSALTPVAVNEIQDHHHIIYDLGIDSIDRVELITFLQEKYAVEASILPDILTIRDLFFTALTLTDHKSG